MSIQVDVWLRGTDVAQTETLDDVTSPPAAWSDDDVRLVLEGMLRTMHRLKHRSEEEVPRRAQRLELDRQSFRGRRRRHRHRNHARRSRCRTV